MKPGTVVDVTQAEIRIGIRNNPVACPIALAIKRGGHAVSASVSNRFVDWAPRENSIFFRRMALGLSARRLVQQFDEGKTVKPTKFYVSEDGRRLLRKR